MATTTAATNLTGQVINQPAIVISPPELHVIYKIRNTKNGKIWFSRRKTKTPNDGFLSNDPKFLKEYKQYGKDAFVKEVLYTFTTEAEANAKEISLIQGRDQSKRLIGASYVQWDWLPVTVSTAV